MLIGTVPGLDGTWSGVDLPTDLLDRCTLWASGQTGLAGAHLDLAAVEALQQMLGEVAAAMRAAR